MGRLYLRSLLLPRYPRLRFPRQKAKNPLQKPLVFTFLCNYLAFILRFLQRVAPLAPRIKNREGLTMAHNESKPSGGRFTVRMIAENSIIAALYVVLTLLVPALSFGPIQCRFSEALVLLCFWRPDITIGLTIGCLISNGIGAAPTHFLLLQEAFHRLDLASALQCRHRWYWALSLRSHGWSDSLAEHPLCRHWRNNRHGCRLRFMGYSCPHEILQYGFPPNSPSRR